MRICTFDIESTGLNSDSGFMLCAGFKELGKKGYVIRLDEAGAAKDRLRIDHKLLLAVRDELETYDGWITWNGKMFDLPFLDDRLLLTGQEMVEKRFHLDIMYFARQGQSRLTSSRLDWVAKAFRVPTSKTALDLNTWKLAEAEALDRFRSGRRNFRYIVDHCLKDLEVTEQVYEILRPRIRNIHKG